MKYNGKIRVVCGGVDGCDYYCNQYPGEADGQCGNLDTDDSGEEICGHEMAWEIRCKACER